MAFLATYSGFGLLFYILLGSSYGPLGAEGSISGWLGGTLGSLARGFRLSIKFQAALLDHVLAAQVWVVFVYFRPQTRHYLHTWIARE